MGVDVTLEYRNIIRVDCFLYRETLSMCLILLVCSSDYTEQSMDANE